MRPVGAFRLLKKGSHRTRSGVSGTSSSDNVLEKLLSLGRQQSFVHLLVNPEDSFAYTGLTRTQTEVFAENNARR